MPESTNSSAGIHTSASTRRVQSRGLQVKSLDFVQAERSRLVPRPDNSQLQSDDNDVIKPITVTLPAKPSFVRIRLRSTDTPLQPNQSYRWFLKVLCSDPNQPKETVEGGIQRIASASPSRSPLDSKQEQTIANESDDRLFDAVAALRLQKPQEASLMEEWNRMLRSLKFELEKHPLTPERVNELATAPLSDLSQ